jgi:hypothetical protein
VLLGALVGGIYAVWAFSKPVLDNLDVKEAIAVALNQSGRDDQALKSVIIDRLQRVGSHWAEDEYGNVVQREGLGLTPDDITVERNEVAGTLFIRVDYERVVPLPPSKSTYTLRFSPQKEGTISR